MDFSEPGWLLDGEETIISATWSAEVHSGSDPAPNSMISGQATASGAVVSQLVVGGLEGVVYLLLCALTLSSGRHVIGRALLKVSTI